MSVSWRKTLLHECQMRRAGTFGERVEADCVPRSGARSPPGRAIGFALTTRRVGRLATRDIRPVTDEVCSGRSQSTATRTADKFDPVSLVSGEGVTQLLLTGAYPALTCMAFLFVGLALERLGVANLRTCPLVTTGAGLMIVVYLGSSLALRIVRVPARGRMSGAGSTPAPSTSQRPAPGQRVPGCRTRGWGSWVPTSAPARPSRSSAASAPPSS